MSNDPQEKTGSSRAIVKSRYLDQKTEVPTGMTPDGDPVINHKSPGQDVGHQMADAHGLYPIKTKKGWVATAIYETLVDTLGQSQDPQYEDLAAILGMTHVGTGYQPPGDQNEYAHMFAQYTDDITDLVNQDTLVLAENDTRVLSVQNLLSSIIGEDIELEYRPGDSFNDWYQQLQEVEYDGQTLLVAVQTKLESMLHQPNNATVDKIRDGVQSFYNALASYVQQPV